MRRPSRARRPGHSAKESLRRGIFLIPSLFTVGNMLCGFASILHAMHGRLELAGWLILLAGVLDGLDGRIARLTRASSEFGKEYDSLADVISFGVAPAILTYQWGLWSLGRWGWAVAFLFLVAGSVRLARFNVHAHEGDRRYFVGLPIPGGAGAVSVMVLVSPEPVIGRAATAAVWVFVLIVAILMVSMIPYRSYKDFDLRQRWPATAFFVIAVVLAVIVVSPVPTMAVICAIYLLAGPTELVRRKLRRTTASTVEPTTSEVLAGESGATSPDHP